MAISLEVRGQTYSIDWFTIAGGGGTSTGGGFSVSGSVGEPVAGDLSGGNYRLAGGFWSLVATVQVFEAPRLSITLTSTNTALISWPSALSDGFFLQQNAEGIASTNWSTEPGVPIQNAGTKYINIRPGAGARFYRLYKGP